jgi:uncharacterized membrane protein
MDIFGWVVLKKHRRNNSGGKSNVNSYGVFGLYINRKRKVLGLADIPSGYRGKRHHVVYFIFSELKCTNVSLKKKKKSFDGK